MMIRGASSPARRPSGASSGSAPALERLAGLRVGQPWLEHPSEEGEVRIGRRRRRIGGTPSPLPRHDASPPRWTRPAASRPPRRLRRAAPTWRAQGAPPRASPAGVRRARRAWRFRLSRQARPPRAAGRRRAGPGPSSVRQATAAGRHAISTAYPPSSSPRIRGTTSVASCSCCRCCAAWGWARAAFSHPQVGGHSISTSRLVPQQVGADHLAQGGALPLRLAATAQRACRHAARLA